MANGAITGGSVVWTLPGGSLSTPQDTGYFASLGTIRVVLTGTYGAAEITGVMGYGRLGARTPPILAYFYMYPGAAVFDWRSVYISNTVTPPTGFTNVFLGAVGRGTLIGSDLYLSISQGPGSQPGHSIELGNEVRTLVPEPTSGALVGFGLVLVGLLGRRTPGTSPAGASAAAPSPKGRSPAAASSGRSRAAR